MNILVTSIVLYESDLDLLSRVIDSLVAACQHASRSSELTCKLDLIDNKPGSNAQAAISAAARQAMMAGIAVSIVESEVNGGYGAGNNTSIRRHADSDYHLVLNPDVLLSENSISHALDFMNAHAEVGLLTPRVSGVDGEIHHLCKRNPTLFDMFLRAISSRRIDSWFASRTRSFAMLERNYDDVIRPVPYPTGCFMFFRGTVVRRIDGFDEGFFLHYEDADIGRRVGQVSETAYVPSVTVVHKWTRGTHKSWRMRFITMRSGFRYWRKWGGTF